MQSLRWRFDVEDTPSLLQALLALPPFDRSHILILEKEQQSAVYNFSCFPYNQVVVAGCTHTAYCVAPRDQEPDDEWMYTVRQSTEAPEDAMLDACWLAYTQGNPFEAKGLLMNVKQSLPEWYCTHLRNLIDRLKPHFPPSNGRVTSASRLNGIPASVTT